MNLLHSINIHSVTAYKPIEHVLNKILKTARALKLQQPLHQICIYNLHVLLYVYKWLSV